MTTELNQQLNPKDIVTWLDRAVSRTEQMGGRGASPKQTWFIATLAAKLGIDAESLGQFVTGRSGLSSKSASEMIDSLLGMQA